MQENLSCYLVRTELISNVRTNATRTVVHKVYVISYIKIHAFSCQSPPINQLKAFLFA